MDNQFTVYHHERLKTNSFDLILISSRKQPVNYIEQKTPPRLIENKKASHQQQTVAHSKEQKKTLRKLKHNAQADGGHATKKVLIAYKYNKIGFCVRISFSRTVLRPQKMFTTKKFGTWPA